MTTEDTKTMKVLHALRPVICRNCGRNIVSADDGSRWLHEHPYMPYAPCRTTFAEPYDDSEDSA